MYDNGSLNGRKRDYLKSVYESDIRFMGRTLQEEREVVRSLPLSKELISDGIPFSNQKFFMIED